MKNTFDLKKFLVENKLTSNSKKLNENLDIEAKAAQVFGDMKTRVILVHGDGEKEERKKGSVKGVINYIHKYAEKAAIQAGDYTVEPSADGNGLLVSIGDQTFDITKA
jgi:hypothetical protein